MSGDEYDHPLLGVHGGYTLAGILYLLLGGLIALGDPVHTAGTSSPADLIVPASAILPFLYAAANGGPLLAFLLSQHAVGTIYVVDRLTGTQTIEPGFALLLLPTGAGAAGIALYATAVRRARDPRSLTYEGYRGNLCFASIVYSSTVVLLGLTRDRWDALREAVPFFEITAGLFVLAGGIVLAYWGIWLRHTLRGEPA